MLFFLFAVALIFEEPITNYIDAKAEELRARAKQILREME